MKLLVVCSGNICRSPMGEAALRARLEAAGLGATEVLSAGTLRIVGEPAHPLAVEAAREAGLDISRHVSRALDEPILSAADVILVMDRSHLAGVERLAPGRPGVHLLGSFLPAREIALRGDEIEDPLGGDAADFRECLRRIDLAAERFCAAVREDRVPERRLAAAPAGEEAEYFERIAERAARARGGGAALTSMEFHIADRWFRAGLPLWLVLEAMEATAGLWPEGKSPRSFLRRCEEEVGRRAADAARPLPEERPAPPSASTPSAAGLLAGRLEEAAGRLEGPDAAPLREALLRGARAVRAGAATPAALGKILETVRHEVAGSARALLDPEEVAAIEEEERRRLRGLSGTVSREAVATTFRRLVEDRIASRIGLPALDPAAFE